MGYSEQTPLLRLPQFQDADKPTWRGDINSAFAVLDTAVGQTQVLANSAVELVKKQGIDENELKKRVTEAAIAAAKEYTRPETGKIALFLGDSYGTGCQEGGNPYITPLGDWATALLNVRDGDGTWIARNYCVDNSGYVTAGRDANFGTMAQRASTQVDASKVRLVSIIGGRNDRGADVSGAVKTTIDKIHQLFPRAKIICYPLWCHERLGPDYQTTLWSVAAGAAEKGVACDLNALFMAAGYPPEQWSGVHPSEQITRLFAGGLVAIDSGGSVPGSFATYLQPGSGARDHHYRVSIDQGGCRLECSGHINGDAPNQPLFARFRSQLFTPGRTLYIVSMGASGWKVFTAVVHKDGRIFGRETLTDWHDGDYFQVVASWPHGISE